MLQLIDFAFQPASVIPTTLFLFVVIYWVIVVFGVLDTHFLDFDIEVDHDLDIDADIDNHLGVDGMHDLDTDVQGASSVMWLNHILIFFNLGRVPFMVFLTFWFIPTWVISILVNEFFNNTSFLPGLLTLAGALTISLFVAKICTWPLVRVFQYLDRQDETAERPIGRVGTALTTVRDGKIGQGEIKMEGNVVRILMCTPRGVELPKGDRYLVIEYKEQEKVYLVEPYTTND